MPENTTAIVPWLKLSLDYIPYTAKMQGVWWFLEILAFLLTFDGLFSLFRGLFICLRLIGVNQKLERLVNRKTIAKVLFNFWSLKIILGFFGILIDVF